MLDGEKILIYDTTLRDGAQSEGISFSVEDKLRITEKLDQLGVHYIEGGWPYSNPKDISYFDQVKALKLQHARIAAFGSTRHRSYSAANDPNLNALVAAQTPVITIFGKSWDLHVREILGIGLEENLDLIHDSINYLTRHTDEVIYDAEHFFDGYRANQEYALNTLEAARSAGAKCIVLCDTNGGTMPDEMELVIEVVKKLIPCTLGVHIHNDSGMAVACSIMAIRQGVRHIQGTINGYGERCGNANLCTIIPNVKLKLKRDCISNESLKKLTETSRFVSELANLKHRSNQPYVGESAFAHKAGVHVSAMQKNALTYQHVDPDAVGNHQRMLVSELLGRGAIVGRAAQYNLGIDKDSPQIKELVATLKELESQGFQFEGAEGSFELLFKKAMGLHRSFFELVGFRVIIEKREEGADPISEATIKVRVGGHIEHTAAEGNGPVNALDNALRKALYKFYPTLSKMELVDYKVRILNEHEGTQAKTRVLIESADEENTWGTVGVSPNIIEASWQALVDSVEYKLLKDEEQNPPNKSEA